MFAIKPWLCQCYLLLFFGIGSIVAQEASLVLPVGHSCPVAKIIYSPDSKYLFSIGEDGSAKLWETETGLLVHDFKAIGDASMVTVSDVCFDRSGKHLVLSYEGSTQGIWDMSTGKNCWDTIALSSIVNPELLAQTISPDGERIIRFGIEEYESPTTIFNKQDHVVLELPTGKSAVRSAAFSNNGKQVFTINEKGVLSFWNAGSGKLIQRAPLAITAVNAAHYSRDDQKLFLSSEANHYIYDIPGKKLRRLSGKLQSEDFSCIKFSNDNKRVGLLYSYQYNSAINTFKSYYDSLIAWDITTGKQILRKGKIYLHSSDDIFSAVNNGVATLSSPNKIVFSNGTISINTSIVTADTITGYCYSPDQRFLAVIDKSHQYYLYEIATSKKIINGELLSAISHQNIYDISISNNGSLAFGCNDYIVSYPSFKKIEQDQYTSYSSKLPVLLDAHFLEDNQTLRLKTLDGFYNWNAVTGSINFTAEKQVDTRNKFSYTTEAQELSPDGTTSLYFAVDIISITSEINNSNLSSRYVYHRGLKEIIRSAHFSPDSKKVVLTMQNNTIKVIDLQQGKMLFNLFPLQSDGFIVTDVIEDSLGFNYMAHFDGSDAARKQLYLACGTEIITLDQLKDLIWVPNLAQRLMKGEAIQAKSLSDLDICGYLPLVEQINKTDEADTYKITPRRGGIGEVTVLVNGTPTKIYEVADLTKKGNYYELVIPKKTLAEYFVAGSDNKIVVKAFTADNSIASRGVSKLVVLQKTEIAPPNLFGVLIGVSEYKSDELKLKYAAKDATEFSKVLRTSAGKLLNTDTANHVFLYNMTTQEDRYQLPEKKAIKTLLQSIGEKAKPNDIIVIFFAGHGVMAKDSSGSQFYFLTTEASTLSSDSRLVKDVGISTSELADWMAPVHMKAQKRILIFDACNSGQAIRDMVSVGADNQGFIAARNDDAAQQIKAIDKLNEKSGLFILSASASDQNAYESSKYAQGFLTYSLLKAIKERSDILEGGQYLDVSRWFNAAKENVGDMAKEAGERQEPQIVTNTNFNIGIVDNDVRNNIVLPQSKSVFTSSNFQNSDDAIADDNLDINNEVNRQLQLASAKEKTSIMYLFVSASPDAYSLSGRYTTHGNAITAKVNFKKGKEIIQRFEIAGRQNDLNKLANDIVSKAIQLLSTSAD